MRYVVLGGGIAGVCCALELARCLREHSQRQTQPQCDAAAGGGGGGCGSGGGPEELPPHPADEVVLVSASSVLKGVREVARLSRLVEELEVVETPLQDLVTRGSGSGGPLRVVLGTATGLDLNRQEVRLRDGDALQYDRLCLCTGARPKELEVPGASHPAVLTLRDTDSVQDLTRRLRGCRRLLLAGNGGIALELAGALLQLGDSNKPNHKPNTTKDAPPQAAARAAAPEPVLVSEQPPPPPPPKQQPELVWVLKHGHVGDAFFDLDAADFLLTERLQPAAAATAAGSAAVEPPAPKALAETAGSGGAAAAAAAAVGRPQVCGHAAGPAWTRELLRGLQLEQQPQQPQQEDVGTGAAAAAAGQAATAPPPPPPAGGGPPAGFRLVLEFSTTVTRIDDGGGKAAGGGAPAAGCSAGAEADTGSAWPVRITLSNGKVYGADLLVCGIGVVPATEWLPPELARGGDGGVAVGRDLRSSDPRVFAAGDCCSADWPDGSPHWFQMRLWTQARVMGSYAAHSMLGRADELAGFNFELFTHVTRFLGTKVVLLGLYNGQRLESVLAEDIRLYTRVAPAENGENNTFVRVLLFRGRMQGAVLIGETELEEALENLILDGLDLTTYGPHILDGDFALDHVFD